MSPHVALGTGVDHSGLMPHPCAGRMERAPLLTPSMGTTPHSLALGEQGGFIHWRCHQDPIKPSQSPSLSLCHPPALSCSSREPTLASHHALSPFHPSPPKKNPLNAPFRAKNSPSPAPTFTPNSPLASIIF